MRSLLFIVFLSLVFGGSAQKYAVISNPAACKAKINAHAKKTSSISAEFKETVLSSMFNTPKTASGIMLYKKDHKIRWEHQQPKKQIILINEKGMRVSENGKETQNASRNQLAKKMQSLMLSLLSGDFLNEKEFSISYFENTENYKLVLVPKNTRMAKYIAEIELIFSKKSLLLHSLSLIETPEDKITYDFSDIQLNSSISDQKFTQF